MAVAEYENSIVLENKYFSLVVGKNGRALSLKTKFTATELLRDCACAMFSVTQERYFNNEMKLMHPAKEIIAEAEGVRYENGNLIVSFQNLPYEAVVKVDIRDDYIGFSLSDFIMSDNSYNGLLLANPPAVKMRFLQLHLSDSMYFGEWMNVSHDDETAVAVMGTSAKTFIGNEKTAEGRILYADAVKGILFKGCSAVLIVSEKKDFLDKVAAFEEDFDLPRGVKSRRSDKINASAYWVHDAVPENIDEHIEYALKGGFSMMLMYYTCFVKEYGGYNLCGDYELRDEYENGLSDVREMLMKIKAKGITPGLHFLHSHIGLHSRYFTPQADYRVLHRQKLTLCREIKEDDSVIFVDQYPFDTDLPAPCRILRFGTELIKYESCTETEPYCYKGCIRGYNGTKAQIHPAGSSGGVVFISEYGATSGYCDQNSSLQDEIAEKIAEIYNQGFSFVYMDGSEGVGAPYEYQIPEAQYRVYRKLENPPVYCEAAAKGHFSWHMLSGGNAFDVFATDVFKSMTDKYPLREAPEMQKDFTRLNFGWWRYFEDSRPDVFEYGTSHAAGFDCPVAIQSDTENLRNNRRTKDNLEVIRRWEDVRKRKLLSEEQKKIIRQPGREFTLLLNAKGEYEPVEYFFVEIPVPEITAFIFSRKNKQFALLCHNTDNADIFIPSCRFILKYEVDGEPVGFLQKENGAVFNVSGRCYLETSLDADELKNVLSQMKKAD